MICPLVKMRCLSPLLLLCYCQFPLLWCYHLLYVLKCSYVRCINIFNCYIFLDWSLNHYEVSFVSCNSLYFKVYLSDMSIATPAFFWFPFEWNIFFRPLIFSLCVSLGLKWVSCRQHIYGSCFCIHSASLCLLVRAVNPFTFKVIFDMYVLITFS